MGIALLYKDVRRYVDDIRSQPSAAIIADFITHWNLNHNELQEAFLIMLRRAIYERDRYIPTTLEKELANNLSLADFSNSPVPQWRFAASFIDYLLGEDIQLDFEKEQLKKNDIAVFEEKLSFGLPHRNKNKLLPIIQRLSNIIKFVSPDQKGQSETFVKLLAADDLLSEDCKDIRIKFLCSTNVAVYVLKKIDDRFATKSEGPLFDKTEIFFRSDGGKFTGNDLYSGHRRANTIEKEIVERINEAFESII